MIGKSKFPPARGNLKNPLSPSGRGFRVRRKLMRPTSKADSETMTDQSDLPQIQKLSFQLRPWSVQLQNRPACLPPLPASQLQTQPRIAHSAPFGYQKLASRLANGPSAQLRMDRFGPIWTEIYALLVPAIYHPQVHREPPLRERPRHPAFPEASQWHWCVSMKTPSFP